MLRLYCLCILLFIIGNANATIDCKASAENNKTAYKAATKKIRQLPEFKAWAKQQKYPVAFQTFSDGQTAIEKQCYWSVSIGANQPDRLAHWQTFYVSVQGEKIWVQDIAGGDPMPLAVWRNRQMGMKRIEDFPSDVSVVIDRATTCQHFAGEFNGDGSKRDKEINTTMKNLKCNKVQNDLHAIRKRYANSKTITEALDRAEEGF
jgi:hypothetical protein